MGLRAHHFKDDGLTLHVPQNEAEKALTEAEEW